ncbi:MAG: hypothetical protein CL752_00970 [Chloroflexi bacterium]|nr:hypothetical protein [Chloroflexota bacterium]|tara:strand:- start:2635 stop:3651 length:1017 start_codon:yes stop_codon:yes gene_type:complete
MELVTVVLISTTTTLICLLFFYFIMKSSLRTLLADTQQNVFESNSKDFLLHMEKETTIIDRELKALHTYIEKTDKDRIRTFTQLDTIIKDQAGNMTNLQKSTENLNAILQSGQSRGQWGERMAEDILKSAGFIENIQYMRNKTMSSNSNRPDFTFLLPENRILNMDVKFPFAAFIRYLDSDDEKIKLNFKNEFIRDAKQRVKEILTRGYIDPENGTLDYVLLFIPNEQVYGFIHEHAPDFLDDALRQKVVLCSPYTLFAILGVIRQTLENFNLSQKTNEILTTLAIFSDEWEKYKISTEKVAKSMELSNKNFEEIIGVRMRALDARIKDIHKIRNDNE